MVSIVQSKATDNSNLLPRKRREELLNGQHVVRDLSGGIEGRAEDFVRFDSLLLVECHTNYGSYESTE